MLNLNIENIINYIKKFGENKGNKWSLKVAKFPNRNLVLVTDGKTVELINMFSGSMLYYLTYKAIFDGPKSLELGKNLAISLFREYEEIGKTVTIYNKLLDKLPEKEKSKLVKI